MKKFYTFFAAFLLIILPNTPAFSQVLSDNFADGNITTSPTWTGGNTVEAGAGFAVNASFQLYTNIAGTGTGTRRAWLTTPLALDLTTNAYEWQFWTKLSFLSPNPPDANNHSRIYLVADTDLIDGNLNGYLIRMQNNVSLLRQDGTTLTTLINGPPLTSPAEANVRVVRTSTGTWLLYVNGIYYGSANDDSHSLSNFFGVNYRYSATARKNDFLFDNPLVHVYTDITPPNITAVTGAAPNQLRINFDEITENSSAETALNYFCNLGIGAAVTATKDPNDASAVFVTFASNFVAGANYTLTATFVEDLFGNAMLPTTFNFTFSDNLPPHIVAVNALSNNAADVLFNEEIALPGAEDESNFAKSVGTANPVAAVRDAANFKLVHLSFSDNFPNNSNILLTADNLTDALGNTMSTPSSRSFVWDTQRPDVCTACVIPQSATQLLVQFSEPVDVVTAQMINNYQVISTNAFPTSAIRNAANPSQVLLTFATPFALEFLYRLRIQNVLDLNGNEMTARIRDFMFDTNPPSVVELRVLNNTTLQIRFNEFVQNTSASDVANYLVSAGIGNPVTAVLFAPNPRLVTLTFATPFADADGLILTVSNVRDLTNNPLLPAQNITFSAKKPSIASVKVLANNQVQVNFSEAVTAASAALATAYTLAGAGACTGVLHTGASVILSFTGSMNSGTNYVLQCSNIGDVFGNVSTLLAENIVYQPHITTVVPISFNLIDVIFESDVTLADAENEAKYQVLSFGTPITAVRDVSQLNIVHLTFSDNFLANTDYTLSAGWFDLENGLTAPVSNHHFFIDTQPPLIANIIILSDNQVELEFSEAIDETTAEALNHYNLLGTGFPTSVVLQSNPKFVKLTFATIFAFGISYTMTVQNVRDLESNTMLPQTLTFSRPSPPTVGQLLISEIMSDPDPQVGLPPFEYIEIYNSSSTSLHLLGVKIYDASGYGTLGNYILPAGQYLILCGSAAADSLSLSGNTLIVSGFPSLSNSGERLRLVSPDGNLIDEITYDDDWHTSAAKKDGGWSLEKRNLMVNCLTGNWTSSTDNRGGTPALINSTNGTFSDVAAPEITATNIVLPTNLTLTFSENADSLSLINSANYVFSPVLSLSSLLWLSDNSVKFTFSTTIDPNTEYRIIAKNIKDCVGNLSNDTAYFALGAKPLSGELLINEIMADEDPSVGLPRAEYIEIYNRSTKLLNLQNVRLSDATTSIALPNVALAAHAYLTLTSTAKADSLRTKVIAAGGSSTQVLGISAFPSLSNTGEKLALRDTIGNLIHAVDYKDSWYAEAVKKNGGWSLEMIDPENYCGEANNWRASVDSRGGTPSKLNSVFAANPDDVAPKVLSLEIISLTKIHIVFNEITDSLSLVSPSNYTLSSLAVAGIEFVNLREIYINFVAPINETQIYTLNVRTRDCAGNAANQTLRFGKGRAPKKGEIILHEIFADESPKVGMSLCEWIEIHNQTDDLLSLQNVSLFDATSAAILPSKAILPNDFMILCAISRSDSFAVLGILPEKILEVPSFPSLNNAGEKLILRNAEGEILHSVDFSDTWYGDAVKKNGGWSLEMIDKNFACSEVGNWKASIDSRGASPASENSVTAENPDNVPPTVTQVNLLSDSVLEIILNEKTDSISITKIDNFDIDKGISITEIFYVNEQNIQLKIAPSAAPNVIYTLTVKQIKDCSGNILSEQKLTFGSGLAPEKFDVLITEILADPSPVVALPEREFIEIFNRSGKIIGLKNIVLHDGGGTANLPDAVLSPGEYVVLCAESSVQMFADFGRVLGVKNFPSLGNEGEKLVLETQNGNFIHALDYSTDWYQSPVKAQGGWTLEMIDTENPCGESNNWRESLHAKGGTPAAENSVRADNPDTDLPKIDALNVLNSNTLEIIFSETTDSLSMLTLENYAIDKGISLNSSIFENPKTLRISLSPAILPEILYTLTAGNVRDCAGNVMNEQKIHFGTGETPQKHDLLITEIMADPAPAVNLPESEFLEIFNRSDKILNLGNVFLSDATKSVRLPFLSILPKQYIILCPTSAVPPFRPLGTVFALSNWLSLDNYGEKLRLFTASGTSIFEIAYDDDWLGDDFKKDGGWSLEMIDAQNPCGENDNWQVSNDLKGGTPGQKNSVARSNPDNRPPLVLRTYAADAATVFVELNEKIDSIQAVNFADLSFDKGILIVEKTMPTPQSLRLKVSPGLAPQTVYTLTLKNLTDCSGNILSETVLRVVMPEKAEKEDVIINEILANPPVEGVDFVEIYNRSSKFLNLQDWSLAAWQDDTLYTPRKITEKPLLLAPGEYLAVSKDNSQLLLQYPKGAAERFWQAENIPAYADSEGSVILLDAQNNIIDRVDYMNDWHFDLIRDQNNVSLERIDFFAPSDDENNWTSAASDVGFGTPGYLNSQHLRNREQRQAKNCFSLSHEVITPDGNGVADFTQIQMACEEPNLSANVLIFDMQGRKMRDLVNNRTISPAGYLTWDGIDNNGKRVPTGYYLIAVELFNAKNGHSDKVFLKVAVGE